MSFPHVFTPPDLYIPAAVNFDGTNDYMTCGAGLTGAADSKLVTGSFWIRKQGSDGVLERIFAGLDTVGGTGLKFRLTKSAANSVQIVGENSAGTVILNVGTASNAAEVADGWLNLLFSFDMTDTGKRHLYLNNANSLNTISTYTDDTIDFTAADWSLGADGDGTNKLSADMADFMLWPGVYLDLSTAANRRLFIIGRRPVNPAVSIAVLGTPLVRQTNALASWHTNAGSGGGFTLTGTLTAAATNPATV